MLKFWDILLLHHLDRNFLATLGKLFTYVFFIHLKEIFINVDIYYFLNDRLVGNKFFLIFLKFQSHKLYLLIINIQS